MNFKQFALSTTVAFLASLSLANISVASDDWLYSGRIGGTYIYNAMSEADLTALLDQRADENVSILELDSRLSYNLSDQEFATEVAFLDQAAELANARGMKAVIYYPTFEVLTANAIDENGQISPTSFANVHPDWVQQGIDGTPNVFYGGQEVWVSPGEESAWLSPNSGYRDYFIDRVEQLAATDLDGVWLDVPIYLDTGTPWPGAEPAAAVAFSAWSRAEGLNDGVGYSVPTGYDMSDPGFRAWVRWRHINVAEFLDDVRAAAQSVNPDFAVIVENYPLDYFDSTTYGLDGSYLPIRDNFIRVWETDSVSNTLASKWSTTDDFENKISMLKWGKSVHVDQPSWSFSYGNEPLDAALTMAATVATQNVPFEAKTPSMLNTVDSDFRTDWFGYVSDHGANLLDSQRTPQVGVWYSSATRDSQDYDVSGRYGMYSVTTPPIEDDSWWATEPADSVVTAPHLSSYRGMSAAMIRMNIPYTIVHGRANGPVADASALDMLVFPGVGAMSDADAQYIRDYVQNGGTALFTGVVPGTQDETGAERSQSVLADLHEFTDEPAARENQYGRGLVIYRPDIIGTELFGAQLDASAAAETFTEIENLVRFHTDEPFMVEDGDGLYVDRAIKSENEHLLYVVNYSGLQLPLVRSIRSVVIDYTAPEGKQVVSVISSTPDDGGLNGFADLSNPGNGVYRIELPVDQFSLLELQLSDTTDQPLNDNNTPVAVTDNLSTNEGTSLTLLDTQLLTNDTDADNDQLSVSGIPSRSANGGRIARLTSGEWRYTPASGFTGTDAVAYSISDGRGGVAIGEVRIVVKVVPTTDHSVDDVTLLSGTLDYGSLEFLNSDDADTYDINAASTAVGNIVDWYAIGYIPNLNEVSRLQATYSGHYSIPNVTQETFLYNFAANDWVSFDTRTVGDQSDSIVRIDIAENATDFIAADGETRIRVRGVQSSEVPTVWANSISWKAYRGVQESTNSAPEALGVSASTAIDTAISVRLLGSDADNDELTYTLDDSGMAGELVGTAPLLTYSPAQGFTGTDNFRYTVTDGLLQSNTATVSINVLPQGSVSNVAASITLDGNLDDWSAYIPFANDPADANAANDQLDWSRAWMAHDGSDYYLAYQNHGPVDVSWGQTVYLDIDDNASTGYQAGLSIGADRVIQGRFIYSYNGTGDDWNWSFITEVQGTSASGSFEYSFPRSTLNNSETINIAFVGSNLPYGGTTEDLYPDGVYDPSASNRYFSYLATVPTNSAPVAGDLSLVTAEQILLVFTLDARDADGDALTYSVLSQPQDGSLSGTAPLINYLPDIGFTGDDSFTYKVNDGMQDSRTATVAINVQSTAQSTVPSNPVNTITINGDLSEWAGLTAFAPDPDDITGLENPVDYLSATMAHNGSDFYLSFGNDGQDVAALQDWLYTIYIDTDLNAATGYQSGLAIGADYMQQGAGVFVYSGTGTDWTWQGVAASNRQALGASVELSIPRQAIGNPAQIRFVMIGDNLSINGNAEDVYPDGTYDSSAATRYLEYRTGGTALEPSILPAFDNAITPVFGRQEMSRNPYMNEQSAGKVVTGGSGVFGLGVGVLLVAGFGLIRRRRFLH